MFSTDVVDGVHLLCRGSTNGFIVEGDGGRLTLVDAGLPRMWDDLTGCLRRVGKSLDDVEALVLTHGHFDHVGFASRLQERTDATVWAHEDDVWLAAHPYRYHPARNRFLFALTHPGSVPHLVPMARAGAFRVEGVDRVRSFVDGQSLDVPGELTVLHTPGHTQGHCAFVLPGRDAIFTGDALVTLDPYTGRRGPRVVARAGTEEPRQALAALPLIEATECGTVLPGHGEPWRRGTSLAAPIAADAGVA